MSTTTKQVVLEMIALVLCGLLSGLCSSAFSDDSPSYLHPLLKCKELYVVEITAVTPRVTVARKDDALPRQEFRRDATLKVAETLLGDRKAGDSFHYPVVAYDLVGSDRPTTPWDFKDLVVGQRFLFAPGGHPWDNQKLDVYEIPLVLDELPSPAAKQLHRTPDLEEIRAVIRIRKLPGVEQAGALRQRMLEKGFSGENAAALIELFAKHPDKAESARTIGEYCLRRDISNDIRRQWVWGLESFRDPRKPGSDAVGKQVCDAYWRILDRGIPPYREDVRLVLHPAIHLVSTLYPLGGFSTEGKWSNGGQGEKYFIEPAKFIPADCSKDRITQALEYAKQNDSSRYDYAGKMSRYDRRLDVLIDYLAGKE